MEGILDSLVDLLFQLLENVFFLFSTFLSPWGTFRNYVCIKGGGSRGDIVQTIRK